MRLATLAVLVLVGTGNAQSNLVATNASLTVMEGGPPVKMVASPLSVLPATAKVAPLIASAEPAPIVLSPTNNAVPDAPSARKFWTLENKINFSIFAGELVADAITTQRGFSLGMREANPLARPFVTHGAGGQAAASAIGMGMAVGTAYLLHRTNHYKAERIAVRLMLAGEGFAVGQNIAVLR